ncbi:MAG TPA: hypothetical protein VMV77_02265 [Bacteroidales bacterium]|nr:hypothetical protein [Bacteroidales bacterium]
MANIRTDRFGNPTMLKMAKSVVDRKTGSVLPIYKTYCEVGNQMIKVEISECKKSTRDGNPGMWVKFTKMSKNRQQGGFGGGSQGYQKGGF